MKRKRIRREIYISNDLEGFKSLRELIKKC